jgi:hypothetical protein
MRIKCCGLRSTFQVRGTEYLVLEPSGGFRDSRSSNGMVSGFPLVERLWIT